METLFPGTAALHKNVHLRLVHFPIAFEHSFREMPFWFF